MNMQIVFIDEQMKGTESKVKNQGEQIGINCNYESWGQKKVIRAYLLSKGVSCLLQLGTVLAVYLLVRCRKWYRYAHTEG